MPVAVVFVVAMVLVSLSRPPLESLSASTSEDSFRTYDERTKLLVSMPPEHATDD